MIKVIVFDVGGVLLKYDLDKLCAQYARLLKANKDLVKKSWFSLLYDAEKGKMSVKKFYDNLCKSINRKASYRFLNNIFYNHFSLNKPVFNFSQRLKRKYKTGILTNSDPRFYRLIKRMFNLKDFDFHIVSYKEGYVKPEKKIYQILIKKARCKPEEIVFIDNYHEFVKGARKLGINGIAFKNLTQLKKDLKKYGVRIS